MKKVFRIKKKYFVDEEFWETISKTVKYIKNQKLSIRKYIYKTGSIYNGEWRGGFRQGKGSMIWADGAQYEGEWNMGRAYGTGKFTHSKGEIYDGDWIHDKA